MRSILVLLVATTLAGAGGCTGDPDFFQYPDAGGTDPGGNDGGNDECNPTVQNDWGETCEVFTNSCPPNTDCQTVDGLSSEFGICATECCGDDDLEHCPDVAPGLERCVIEDTYYQRWYCAVLCYNDADCNEGQTCQLANSADKICYPEP